MRADFAALLQALAVRPFAEQFALAVVAQALADLLVAFADFVVVLVIQRAVARWHRRRAFARAPAAFAVFLIQLCAQKLVLRVLDARIIGFGALFQGDVL